MQDNIQLGEYASMSLLRLKIHSGSAESNGYFIRKLNSLLFPDHSCILAVQHIENICLDIQA